MSKSARERTARERLAEQRARDAAREQRMRGLTITVAAIAVVAIAVVVGVLVANKKSGGDGWDTYAGPYAPVTRQTDGSYLMAQSGASAPTLDVYEDLQCPYCKAFEKANGGSLERLAYQGKVRVVYHVIAFVNPTGSLRGAVALGCAYDAGKFAQFHNVAYREQGSETVALTTGRLKDYGRTAGITSGTFTQCVDAQREAGAQQTLTNNAEAYLKQRAQGGSWGTPTLFLDGKQINSQDIFNKGGLAPMIAAASPSAPGNAPSGGASASPQAGTSSTP
jgi:protein-disulfide isomerase